MKDKTIKRKMNISMCAACVLFYLTLISVCLTSGLYARYTVTDSASDEARVAVMATDVSIVLSDTIPSYPGDWISIPVTIANYEGEGSTDKNVCEVAQSYRLSAKSLEDNIPYVIEFYVDERCETQALTEAELTGSFEASKEKSITYYMKILWPVEFNNASYAFEIDAIEVSVNVEQID